MRLVWEESMRRPQTLLAEGPTGTITVWYDRNGDIEPGWYASIPEYVTYQAKSADDAKAWAQAYVENLK